MSHYATGMRCTICRTGYGIQERRYTCPGCGPAGTLDVEYDYDRIAATWSKDEVAALTADPTMWRYRPLLPVAADSEIPPLAVGGTPLYDTPRLAADIGVAQVWVKDDGRQPTASLKDRASAMTLVKAAEEGADVITTASTGNAAAALAGLSASMGRRCVIFVPKSAPPAKIAQLHAYGATVVLVNGTYTDAFELATEAVDVFGWYNRNTGINPYTTEGKKTVALEIAEQLGWKMPDAVFVSVGDGSIIGAVHKGFADLHRMRWINRMPRIFGVQAAGSDYLVQAYENGEDVVTKPPILATTRADSISADLPRDRVKAMRAVTTTHGAFVRVTDDDILSAVPRLARLTGVFAEPAGAACLAGAAAARDAGLIDESTSVVLVVTGNGLKDVAAVMDSVTAAGSAAISIDADINALRAALEEQGITTS